MENETRATVRRWPIIFIFATYSLTSAFQVSWVEMRVENISD